MRMSKLHRLIPTGSTLLLAACGADPMINNWDCTSLTYNGSGEACPLAYTEDGVYVSTYAYGLDITSTTVGTFWR